MTTLILVYILEIFIMIIYSGINKSEYQEHSNHEKAIQHLSHIFKSILPSGNFVLHWKVV